MTQSGFAAFASSGRISGSGLASARISGRSAIFLTIEGFRTPPADSPRNTDRKSTRLNSSHLVISYAVFCLKKKKKKKNITQHTLHTLYKHCTVPLTQLV